MVNHLVEWLSGVFFSTASLCFIAYVMRGAISRFFTKTVELRFEKKIETFKSEKRDNEKELEQIRNFLVAARKDRDSAIQIKKLEAAESLMRMRQFLFGFNMLVEFLKIIKIEEALKNGNDPRFTDFIITLSKPFDIDAKLTEYKNFDKTLHELYLSDNSLSSFRIYESIVLYAVSVMKMLALPLEGKHNFIDFSKVTNKIINLVPSSKDGFEKFGDNHALYWVEYFYTETLKEVRFELLGVQRFDADADIATKLR